MGRLLSVDVDSAGLGVLDLFKGWAFLPVEILPYDLQSKSDENVQPTCVARPKGLPLASLIQNPSDKDNLYMNTFDPSNSDSQPSFSWPRRLAIAGCLIVGCVFSFRAMTQDVAAKVTSETSQPAELQAAVELTASAEADVKLVTKNIEDIQAGDLVLARDEHGSAIGLKPVKETYQRVSHHLRHLTFETPDGTQQTLSTTDEHPFWSVTAYEFVEAGSLIVGNSVTDPNGETQTLVRSAREEFPDGVPVFNFQVTDYHTYFVAASADKPVMLVHNAEYGNLLPTISPPEELADRARLGEWLKGRLKKAEDRFEDLRGEMPTNEIDAMGFDDFKAARLDSLNEAIQSTRNQIGANSTRIDELLMQLYPQ